MNCGVVTVHAVLLAATVFSVVRMVASWPEASGGRTISSRLSCPFLDELVLDAACGSEQGALQQAVELLHIGQAAASVELLRAAYPSALRDVRLQWLLNKRVFVELLQQGDQDNAIAWAREHVAPLALDAHPEAYPEFKRLMCLLLYRSSASDLPSAGKSSLLHELATMNTQAARAELAEVVMHTIRLRLGWEQTPLELLLVYLCRLLRQHHERFPRSMACQPPCQEPRVKHGSAAGPAHPASCCAKGGEAGADSVAARALAAALLLPGQDAAPLDCSASAHAPSDFKEADVQALIQGIGITRREAVAALRRHGNDLRAACKAELGRLRLNRPLFQELLQEYMDIMGLHAQGTALSCVHLSKDAALDQPQAAMGHAAIQPVGQPVCKVPATTQLCGLCSSSRSSLADDGPTGLQVHLSCLPALSMSGRGGSSLKTDGAEHHLRSISKSPPTKLQKCSTGCLGELTLHAAGGTRGPGPVLSQPTPADIQHQQPRYPAITALAGSSQPGGGMQGQEVAAQLAQAAETGGAEALLRAIGMLDQELIQREPPLHFALLQLRMRECLLEGQVAEALQLARQRLTPLANQHPPLKPLLKAAMASMLQAQQGDGKQGPAANALKAETLTLAATCATLMRQTHAARQPRLVLLLQELLQLHASWQYAERYSDPFSGPLLISALRTHLLPPPSRPAPPSPTRTHARSLAWSGPSPEHGSQEVHRMVEDGVRRRLAAVAAAEAAADAAGAETTGDEDGPMEFGAYRDGRQQAARVMRQLGRDGEARAQGALQPPPPWPYAVHRGLLDEGAQVSTWQHALEQGPAYMQGGPLTALPRMWEPHPVGGLDSLLQPDQSALLASRMSVDEEGILRLMEILELPRLQAIDLLSAHAGDVEAAVMSFLR